MKRELGVMKVSCILMSGGRYGVGEEVVVWVWVGFYRVEIFF